MEVDINSNVQLPRPAPELDCLTPLTGKWHTRGRTQDSILGPGVTVTSTEEFFWLEGGHFLVQTYETAVGGEPVQKGINYWFFDRESQKFGVIFFSNNGSYTEDGNRYEGKAEGRALTFVGPARCQGSWSQTFAFRCRNVWSAKPLI